MSTQYELQQRFLDQPEANVLDAVTSPEWKAAAALAAVTNDVALKARLLDIGIASAAPLQDNERALLTRRALLQDRDLVSSYLAIYATPSAPEEHLDGWDDIETDPTPISLAALPLSLTEFLQTSLVDLACHYAATASLAALRVIYQRHGAFLTAQDQFKVASQIPLCTPSIEGLPFLPNQDGKSAIPYEPWRSNADSADEPIPDAAPLSAHKLTDWYLDRIRRTEAEAGLVDEALSLVQHAAARGVQGLEEFGEDLSLLARMVYDRPSASDLEDWTLNRWQSSTPSQIFQAYLEGSTEATVVDDLRKLALPYAFVIESKLERHGEADPTLHDALLREFLFACSISSKVPVLAAVIQASKPTLPPQQRLIQSDDDLARIALACLYGCPSLNLWPEMASILECLPAFESAEEAHANPLQNQARPIHPQQLYAAVGASSQADLSGCLDRLDVHLEQAETFARWNAAVPLIWFLESELDDARQRNQAIKMCRLAAQGRTELESEDEWEALKDDLCRMTVSQPGLPAALGRLEESEVLRIFFNGLLSAGRFSLAKSLFNPSSGSRPIDPGLQERLVLDASRELYDNAETANLHRGAMKLAYECLAVAPPTPELRKEREFIEATSRLASFHLESEPGVPLSPIQIRLTKDKVSLIARLLASNETAYAHPDVIMELVQKLGHRGDKTAEIRVLAILAESALRARDFTQASDTCSRLVKTLEELKRARPTADALAVAQQLAWASCYQVGNQQEYRDFPKRMELLGHALLLCPPSQIERTLNVWRAAEAQSHTQIVPPQLTSTTSPVISIDQVPVASDSAINMSYSAAAYLGSSANSNSSPGRSRPASSAFDTLLVGREGGVRDSLTHQLASGVSWLIGDDSTRT